jgi:hypothetical protein
MRKFRFFKVKGSWYILPAHPEDKALLESNLSTRWASRRMGRVETLSKSRDPQI